MSPGSPAPWQEARSEDERGLDHDADKGDSRRGRGEFRQKSPGAPFVAGAAKTNNACACLQEAHCATDSTPSLTHVFIAY